MAKNREVVACTVCGDSIYKGADGLPRTVADDSVHRCPSSKAKPAPPPPAEKSDSTTCTSCGLRSRSALIVKPLDGDRGRCVNTAACEKRQHRLAKADT